MVLGNHVPTVFQWYFITEPAINSEKIIPMDLKSILSEHNPGLIRPLPVIDISGGFVI